MECNDPEQVQFIGRLEAFLLRQRKYFFFFKLQSRQCSHNEINIFILKFLYNM